jgi:hypothetical protein
MSVRFGRPAGLLVEDQHTLTCPGEAEASGLAAPQTRLVWSPRTRFRPDTVAVTRAFLE